MRFLISEVPLYAILEIPRVSTRIRMVYSPFDNTGYNVLYQSDVQTRPPHTRHYRGGPPTHSSRGGRLGTGLGVRVQACPRERCPEAVPRRFRCPEAVPNVPRQSRSGSKEPSRGASNPSPCRATSLMRSRIPLRPYSRPIYNTNVVLGGAGRLLVSEVSLLAQHDEA